MLSLLGGTLGQQFLKRKALLPLALVGAYLIGTIYIMFPKLSDLLIPVGLYACTLSITGFLGILLWRETKTKTTAHLAMGCFLFMVSDSMIAFDAFYFSEAVFTHWVMITYIPAQYLISLLLRKSQ